MSPEFWKFLSDNFFGIFVLCLVFGGSIIAAITNMWNNLHSSRVKIAQAKAKEAEEKRKTKELEIEEKRLGTQPKYEDPTNEEMPPMMQQRPFNQEEGYGPRY